MAATAEKVTVEPGEALATRPTDSFALMVERLASNPNVDVAKLEKLIEMQERILAHNAEAAFNAAFAEMQAEIPTVVERGKTDKGTYAQLEDIVEAIRPVLQRHGFALSHRTEWPDKSTVKVVGILTHREGHSRTSEFLSTADTSGSKNAIQALGSAVAYGRRYTTKDLLNIATRHEDDDGHNSAKAHRPDAVVPEGFDNWLIDLEVVADEGVGRLQAAWNASKPDHRRYLLATKKTVWETLKKKAAKVAK